MCNNNKTVTVRRRWRNGCQFRVEFMVDLIEKEVRWKNFGLIQKDDTEDIVRNYWDNCGKCYQQTNKLVDGREDTSSKSPGL